MLGDQDMEVSKFIVGIMTIAIGLWGAGRLAPAVVGFGKLAVQASQQHKDFSLKNWNKSLIK